MQLQLVAVFCVFAAVLCFVGLQDAEAAATTVRPYKFGFRLDDYSQQHRKETRDERGIVMGEFGFITADGIYHVTVYATDEDGKFRILAMRNFPYEKQPKTIDMVVAAKPKPTVIAVAAPKKSTLPAFNFGQEACSGCFLVNKAPKETPAAVKKNEIRPLSQTLPPSPPENTITGTGQGKDLINKALPKVLNNFKNAAKQVHSPIRPTIEDTVGIAQVARLNGKKPNTHSKQTPTQTQHHPQTADSQVRYATAIIAKDNLGKPQIRLTDVTNKQPKLVTDVKSSPSNSVAKITPLTPTSKNIVRDNLGQPQRRLTTVPNALPSSATQNNNIVRDNIGNAQRRLTTVNTSAPAARITSGSKSPGAGAVFGQRPVSQKLNTNVLIPTTHTTSAQRTQTTPAFSAATYPKPANTNSNRTPVVTARKDATPPGGKFSTPLSTPITGTAKTQPDSVYGGGKIEPRFGDSPNAPEINSQNGDSSLPNSSPSGQKPNGASTVTKPQSGGAAGFGGPAGKASTAGDAGDLYRFKYTLDYNGHQETGSRNGNKKGSFFSIGDDNIERTIEYIANEFGYYPRIRWRKLDAPIKPKENTLKDYEFVWFKE